MSVFMNWLSVFTGVLLAFKVVSLGVDQKGVSPYLECFSSEIHMSNLFKEDDRLTRNQ